MSNKNTTENGFIKLIKGFGFLEYSILIGVLAFGGLFIFSYAYNPETTSENPDAKVRIYDFYGQSCPHCARANTFLTRLEREMDDVEVLKYEIENNPRNRIKFEQVAQHLNTEARGVPFIIIGDQYFNGFSPEIEQEMRERVDYCLIEGCSDTVAEVVGLETTLEWEDISVNEAKDLIANNKDNPDFVILDVRTPAEFNENKIAENAINIDVESPDFEARIKTELDPDKTYLVYCRTARRSQIATEIMAENGFQDLYNMLGGTVEWYN